MPQLATNAAENSGALGSRAPVCFLCGSEAMRELWDGTDKLFRRPGRFTYWRCQACSLIILHPRPLDSELPFYYPDYVTPVSTGDSLRQRMKRMVAEEWYGYGPDPAQSAWRPSALLRKVITFPLRSLLSQIPRKKPRGRVLDIGCGSGGYLAFLASLGWMCHGVELGENSRTYAREVLGLNVHAGPLEACDLPDEYFDVVTMWHVIEHLTEPIVTLREIHRLLKSDGVLLLSTPNVGSLDARLFGRSWYGLDPPRHLYLLTPHTATQLLARAGFEVIRIRSEHHPTSVSRSLLYLFEDWEWPRARAAVARWIRVLEWGLWSCSPLRALFGYGSIIHLEVRKRPQRTVPPGVT